MRALTIFFLIFFVLSIDAEKSRTINRNGFKLVVTDKNSGIPMSTQKRMIDVFFQVYPKMVREFNQQAVRTVKFIFEHDLDFIAGTGHDTIRFQSKHMIEHPNDVDVVTHEGMHVVQDYKQAKNLRGWMVEGIADFARHKFGVANKKVGWKITPPSNGQKYDTGYTVTAGFLVWIEQQHRGAVKKFDSIIRNNQYEDNKTWKQVTGKTVEEQWEAYKTKGHGGQQKRRKTRGSRKHRG